ncbi:hypothetical protein HYO29_04070 [Vibrio parahaemolyticus]|nr:hypothetical protein [Vibrio parahaemolyticus]MBM4938065.1 hypothetical protein [Vibrio parahaemolyticus]
MSAIWPDVRTIRKSHPKLRRFATILCPGAKVVRVNSYKTLRPIGLCYWNVDELVRNYGGEAVYGWQFFIWPKRYIEAMHHAVWRTPDGKLFDVTEKYPTDTIKDHSIFLEDDSISVELTKPMFIQSRYFPLNKHPEIDAFISAYQKKNALEQAQAALAYEYGYRNQGQFAKAKGGTFDINSIDFSSDFYKQLEPIKAEFNQVLSEVGSTINAIKRLDAKDKLKRN